MRTLRLVLTTLLGLMMCGALALFAAPASAQSQANPCAPGQPSGITPGQPPANPGQPSGRPPAYPPGFCALQLSKGAAQRGESVTASGSGYVPGETVTLRLGNQVVKTATADASGNFTTTFVVPNDAPIGRTQVLASSASRQLSASFEVLAAAATRGASLPRTGAYIAGIALLGAVLIALGAAFVTGARRRRSPVTAS